MVPYEPICVPDGGMQCTKWISNYDGRYKGLIPLRETLAESRNTVAIWFTEQIGIASILRTSRILGVRTTLQPFAATALGASEMNLLELANAYRAIASGILRPRGSNRRRPHRFRRQSLSRIQGNRQQGCAAGVQGNHAQDVPWKPGRACSGVSGSNGREHYRVPERRLAGQYRPAAAEHACDGNLLEGLP